MLTVKSFFNFMYANGQVIMQLKSSEKSLYKFALQPGMLPFAKAPRSQRPVKRLWNWDRGDDIEHVRLICSLKAFWLLFPSPADEFHISHKQHR